jgi:hypothetical protein
MRRGIVKSILFMRRGVMNDTHFVKKGIMSREVKAMKASSHFSAYLYIKPIKHGTNLHD